ncbi:MAG: alpha/beta hydrolase [Oleiphilaceae bacterium]|nr:alpha/beta hydrolase [Oleiphilaceae bacterium]
MTDQSLPPVVIVHGMWSTGDTLRDIRTSFEKSGFEVHTPNLPGHKPKHTMGENDCQTLIGFGVEDYVRCVQNLINNLDRAPILIGHSMGALIAQLVAARTSLEALVLMSSAPPAGVNGWRWSVLRTFGRNLFIFPLWKKTTEIELKHVRYGIANTQNASIQESVARDSTFESGRASFEIGMPFLFRHPPTRIRPEAIDCPVLMLGGTEDRITPIGVQRKIVELYQGRARLIELPGVCHWTIGGTALPLVKQHILNWLKQQGIEVPTSRAA